MVGGENKHPLGIFMQLAFVLAAAGLVYSFVRVAKEGELRRRCAATCLLRPDYAGVDRTLPAFSLDDIQGHAVSLDALAGKVIVLNFWTRTCGPCLEEMPSIAELTKVLHAREDVAVVTISTDESADTVRDTLKSILREDPPFRVLVDTDSKVIGGQFGTHLFPETWFIDKHGVIRARFDGARDWSSPAVIEFIDQLRNDGYCPVDVHDGHYEGEGAPICPSVTGGS